MRHSLSHILDYVSPFIIFSFAPYGADICYCFAVVMYCCMNITDKGTGETALYVVFLFVPSSSVLVGSS